MFDHRRDTGEDVMPSSSRAVVSLEAGSRPSTHHGSIRSKSGFPSWCESSIRRGNYASKDMLKTADLIVHVSADALAFFFDEARNATVGHHDGYMSVPAGEPWS